MRALVYHRAVAAASHWLIKSEPSVYAWSKLVKDGKTRWDGVRNFTARNYLRAMKVGDGCFFYHSNEGKEIVGVARVCRAAYPDPTGEGADWSAVDVEPDHALVAPVSLATIKATAALASMQLVTHSRLSVQCVTAAEWKAVLAMGKTKAPRR
ncbi:MAG: EVE domain-containing protein [Polyangiales bacterium]